MLRRFVQITLPAGIVLSAVAIAAADGAPVVDRDAHARDALGVAERIDAVVDRRLTELQLSAERLSDDVEFLRRAYLDITGCIPTANQAEAFLAGDKTDHRARLVDKLLASEGFGVQLGRVWRDWIAPAELPSEGNGGNQPIKATRDLGAWFAARFNENAPWNEIVESVLNVDGTLKDSPQGLFFSLTGTDTGIPEPAGATRAVAQLFLGLDIQCAQCHDDPYRGWKQTEFWGVAAFFRNMQAKFKGRYFDSITESFGRKLEKNAKKTTTRDRAPNGSITIPESSFENAGSIVPAAFVHGDEIEAKERQPLRPVFSSWLVSSENPYLARAFVNRTWKYFFSRGLVEPVDDMRPDNAPTHAEILDLLTREFVESSFDIKHLVRCIVSTRAYQRTSDSSDGPTGDADAASVLARRRVKLMSTDQLYDSLELALSDPKLDLRTYDDKESRRFGESSPVGDEYTEFQRLFETDENDSTNFTHGIPQFLALLNHPSVSSGGGTVERLVKEGVEPAVAVERLYMRTLSRRPSDEERREALDFIESSETRTEAYGGVLWMLVNRSEFILIP